MGGGTLQLAEARQGCLRLRCCCCSLLAEQLGLLQGL